MTALRAVGRDASSKKYDILSAMMAYAMASDKQTQKQVMRLMSLITTRYNWRNDDLTMGHEDMARLWSVEPRTVKREMAKFKSRGWIEVKRAGARGRVGSYRICFDTLLEISKPHWPAIGPDFCERAGGLLPQEKPISRVVKVDFGAGLSDEGQSVRPNVWRDVRGALREQDASNFDNWYGRLDFVEVDGSTLVLKAPSAFVARYVQTHLSSVLFAAAKLAYPEIEALRFEV